nr:hypothetical protein [Planctomycetota bacterium]
RLLILADADAIVADGEDDLVRFDARGDADCGRPLLAEREGVAYPADLPGKGVETQNGYR